MIMIDQVTECGQISPLKLADATQSTAAEIADAIGLSENRLLHPNSPHTQKTLREFAEILAEACIAAGNPAAAFAWFRSDPLVGFGGRTPEQVFKDDGAQALVTHVRRRLAGGYA